MSAFPAGLPTNNSLHDRRNELRKEVAVLRGAVAQLANWVEQIERDRIELVGVGKPYATDADFDNAWNTLAANMLSAIRNESSLSTASLLYRINNVTVPAGLGMTAPNTKGFSYTALITSSSATWTITHNLGYNPTVAPARADCDYIGGTMPVGNSLTVGDTWWSDEMDKAVYWNGTSWADFNVIVYTWDTNQTVLTHVTPSTVTYPTANVSITITLASSAQGVVKFI